MSIIDSTSGEPREVVRHGPNSFVGDIDILTGRPAVISAIASGNCVAYEVSADRIRRLLDDPPDLSDLLLDRVPIELHYASNAEIYNQAVFDTQLRKLGEFVEAWLSGSKTL